MKRNLFLTGAVVLAMQGTSHAQDRAAIKAVCLADIKQLCPSVKRDVDEVKGCLVAQKDKLSAGCKALFKKR